MNEEFEIKYVVKQENENWVVYLYANTQEAPFIYQPYYPNGSPFRNQEDALKWAKQKYEELTIEGAPYADNEPDQLHRVYYTDIAAKTVVKEPTVND